MLTKHSARNLYRLPQLTYKAAILSARTPILPSIQQSTTRSSTFSFRRTMSSDNKTKSESEWQAVLSPEQFRILRKKGTEPGALNQLDYHLKLA
jgi:peptide-methionine (R)-S-oxide reductase